MGRSSMAQEQLDHHQIHVVACDITSAAAAFFGSGTQADLLFVNDGYAALESFHAELAGRRIRVNAVSPGFVQTPTMGVANASADNRTAFEGEGVKLTPLGRIGDPEEIARAVLFLGFEATFTTGSQVVLDGILSSLQVH
ncbi:uncharacterized protein KD926_001751 [Aspergillus affinis]|uniref:uncharacterized protein n=1 Tax=Aspergillus affinis TaxID=1070780 RepID=UPI0022FEB79D|nr:uncharacterized protein KD926_001751 [Aspergillus affinis]KAI9036540.1 hypothetical protein KD926_001751 [Aspergillus affinis]